MKSDYEMPKTYLMVTYSCEYHKTHYITLKPLIKSNHNISYWSVVFEIQLQTSY
jgi:hypothetical protein